MLLGKSSGLRECGMGLMEKVDYERGPPTIGPTDLPLSMILGKKIVLLDETNLNKLRAYKAYAEWNKHGELVITLTGFSVKGVKELYDSLEEMTIEEIDEKFLKR